MLEGSGTWLMALIFDGEGCSPVELITWPRYSIEAVAKSAFRLLNSETGRLYIHA